MTSRTRHGWAVLLMLVAGIGMASVPQARAQSVPSDDNAEAVAETSASDTNDADVKDLELDWSQLNIDTATLPPGPASKARLPKAAVGTDTSWTSKDKSNGATAVSVKQPLSPFWDTRIGADMTVINQPQTLTSADLLRQKISGDNQPTQSSGTAWAAITAPGVGSIWDKTAIEARIDPAQEQSKLGTSLSKSLPLSEQYSLTLQNGYNVIQQGIVPVPGSAGHAARPIKRSNRRSSALRTPAPVSSPASRCHPLKTSGFARSAPSRNCSAASPSTARSAKPRSAPRTRV